MRGDITIKNSSNLVVCHAAGEIKLETLGAGTGEVDGIVSGKLFY